MSDICLKSGVELSELLAKKELSSFEVVEAYLKRIEQINPKINAYTHVFHEQAIEDAKRLDKERSKGLVEGKLHGVPISVKECFDIGGEVTTIGIKSRRAKALKDAALVSALKSAGAIVLGRTNVSQFMLFHESRNPVYGQTNNPFDLERTPGGSSGGEAAAIAAGISPMGIGTDIGGSIRIPSHFSGICGIKLSLDRWPMQGVVGGLAGQEAIRSAGGPMARTTDDLIMMIEALDSSNLTRLDSRVPPLPWFDVNSVNIKKLRVGYMRFDGVVQPSKAVLRALDESIRALRDYGVEVVPFDPPHNYTPILDYISLMTSDGGRGVKKVKRESELDYIVESSLKSVNLGKLSRSVLAALLKQFGEGQVGEILKRTGERTVSDYWGLILRIRQYREVFLSEMERQQVDVIVCPPHATCALQHGASKNFAPAGSFSMLFNLLQFPAGAVPVTTVQHSEQVHELFSNSFFEKSARKVSSNSEGLPVGVQVVAKPWYDETALAVMKFLETAAKQSPQYPQTPVPI